MLALAEVAAPFQQARGSCQRRETRHILRRSPQLRYLPGAGPRLAPGSRQSNSASQGRLGLSTFDDFFYTATEHWPYGYQVRVAQDGLPAVVQAPTGAGKTGVVLAWLWRRLQGPDPAAVPRRLIYALPQRSLVEQVADQVTGWLKNLALTDKVALHVVMGGEGKSQAQWRLDMHRPAIVVGTVDSLVSKALNRGYGIARATYPIDFALVTNGAHWIIDEIQLCPESTTTLRQLAAFARSFGTAEPFGLTCMSATVSEALLDTVDNPAPRLEDVLSIEPADRIGELAVRLNGRRTVQRLKLEPGAYGAIAEDVRARHRPGTLTLVVLNTVNAAREVYKGLRGTSARCTLVHSRFRGYERQQLVRRITEEPGPEGSIVVATQVVEAGIDLNAALLVTEAAPWPCVAQRAGRCNRTGRVQDAVLCWLPPAKPAPYPEADVAAAVAELEALEGVAVTGEELLQRAVPTTAQAVAVLRRTDLLTLFDTSPDLSGADLDVAPYVRDVDDLDVQLAWATWTPEPGGADGRPPAEVKAPAAEWRCRVPLVGVAELVKKDIRVWRLDQAIGRWTRVTVSDRARPGEVLVVAASDGGYDLEAGFDPAARGLVADSPHLMTTADLAAGTEDTFGADSASVAQSEWIKLQQHSDETRAQAEALIHVMQPDVPEKAAKSAVVGAYLHDIGKAHRIWQRALCKLAPDERRTEIEAGQPWAKSGNYGRLQFEGSASFRHELASLLLLEGPLSQLLAEASDPDLAKYLVLAHHGKLRIQVREATDQVPDVVLGLKQDDVAEIPPLLGQPASHLSINLDQFSLGGEQSWTREALALRDRWGPFVLAYLETVVRIADWRASARVEVAG
jgi:CRISPR-associated endonuclease/helicase Cas3